jgi:DmsE family decaheme c-type cytochrome
MSMRPYAIGALVLLLCLGLSSAVIAQQQPAAAAAPAAEIPSCGDCHDQAKVFATNPHGHGKAEKGVVPNSVCESCHGPGQAHIESGGEKDKIIKPAGRAGADKTCLTCHDLANDQVSRHAGMHANSATVNCLTCHSIHSSAPRETHLLVKNQLALCNTCHQPQVSSFRNKPFGHHIGRAGMNCTSCHEPHGRPARESMRTTFAGESTCLNCHADKRGPFVFQHGSVAIGECTTCHEQHGSSNPRRLKRANVWQLCIECHSPIAGDTLGSQPPSFHNLSNPRYLNCTNCHVAIHGSNRSPQLFK